MINIGSIEGLASNRGHPAYSASKAGIHGFTAAVAVDHGLEGSGAMPLHRAGSILISASSTSTAWPIATASALLAMHPVGRLGEPTAVWLASAENAFVTGQVYVIDGGRTKKLQLPIP